MKTRWLFLGLLLLPIFGPPRAAVPEAAAQGDRKTWAERLGWPSDKRVIILHADDIGMCYEVNASAQRALSEGEYRSAAPMVPCPSPERTGVRTGECERPWHFRVFGFFLVVLLLCLP